MSANASVIKGGLFDLSPAQRVAGILIANLLLILSAKIQIPFWPVPMTMQTFAVLMIGAALGARDGAAAIALYLFEGALGFAVFANSPERGIGLAYMYGPTGGYLMGFLVAALAVGFASGKGWMKSFTGNVVWMLAGHAIMFALGIAWLSHLIGFNAALAAGLYPFWLATALKTAMAVAAYEALRRRYAA
ncbi:MAG: biotin transporter BioY [Xanthobacteraceae bacterium]|nr:biotin transporter BioY [Xanthobacteraceae bacterium]MBX3535944.1 biotin transporter BioY [Xanthobacteraceae bacterium]MCW5674491.1 biotin transporter BioY [Xanthobacteraceae bacterium]MCW5678808.1 biotin transporter BioY [Xanthobacteraceae bacterium]